MKIKNNVFLITGVAGFIGFHLAKRLLENENTVIGVDNFDPAYDIKIKKFRISKINNKKFKFFEKDILNTREIQKIIKENSVEGIFHLAAKAGVRDSLRMPQEYEKTNVEGSYSILNACINTGVKKLIFTSTASVYGNTKYLPIDENHPTNPISVYGKTKLKAEKLFFDLNNKQEFQTMVIRYFNAYGLLGRPDSVIYIFLNKIHNNKPVLIFGDGEQTRAFTNVLDIVNGTLLCMEKDISGDVINLGSNKNITINKLVEMLEIFTNKKIRREYVKKNEGEIEHIKASTKKAKEILNWDPKISIEGGLKEVVEKFNISLYTI